MSNSDEKYETIVTEVTLIPTGDRLFSEHGFAIILSCDETGADYVEVSCQMEGYGKIAIDPDEWPRLRKEIDAAFKRVRT